VNAVDANGETAMHGATARISLGGAVPGDKGVKDRNLESENKQAGRRYDREATVPNFKPSAETIAALHRVMLAVCVSPPTNAPPVAPSGPDYKSPTVKKQGQ
jgi:hypothetical protein